MDGKKVYQIKIDGVEQAINDTKTLGETVKTTDNSYKEIQKALKAVKSEMTNFDKSSDEWTRLAKVAGEYRDQLDDINQATRRYASDTKALDDAINVGQSLTSVFTAAKGAMSAFGVSTEGAVETIKELQEGMAIIQSLQALQNSLRGSTATTDLLAKAQSLLGINLIKNQAASIKATIADKGLSVAQKAGAVTAKGLGLALKAIPLMLIVGLIAMVVANWEDLVGWFTKTFPALDKLKQKFGGIAGMLSGLGKVFKLFSKNVLQNLAEVFKNLFSGKFEAAWESAKKITQYNMDAIKKAFWEGVTESKVAAEEEKKNHEKKEKAKVKSTKDAAKEIEEIEKALRDGLKKMESQGTATFVEERNKRIAAEKKYQDELSKLRKDSLKADEKYEKQRLNLELKAATTEEEKLEIKKKIIALDKKIAERELKENAAAALGMSTEELESRLTNIEATYVGLKEGEKEIMKTLITNLQTVKAAAEAATIDAYDSFNSSTNSKKEGDGNGDGKKKKMPTWEEWADFGMETFGGIADSLSMIMDGVLEELEAKLEEAEELHDKAVEKVKESQDKISDIQERMKDSSGAELESFRQQMAEEKILLAERETEERRLQKEKERREKELEKKQRQARRQEMQLNIIQSIANTAMGVTQVYKQWGWPMGAVFGAVLGAMGLAQVAIMTKQLSKMADGGVLGGREHKDGGNPIPSMGVEVEKGEAVINKRSTAKYLPLLDAINAEGNGGKHTLLQSSGNAIRKYADGGVLNYQRIAQNLDSINQARIIENAISNINFHPVVEVVQIAKGINQLTEVRQLAGANSPIN